MPRAGHDRQRRARAAASRAISCAIVAPACAVISRRSRVDRDDPVERRSCRARRRRRSGPRPRSCVRRRARSARLRTRAPRRARRGRPASSRGASTRQLAGAVAAPAAQRSSRARGRAPRAQLNDRHRRRRGTAALHATLSASSARSRRISSSGAWPAPARDQRRVAGQPQHERERSTATYQATCAGRVNAQPLYAITPSPADTDERQRAGRRASSARSVGTGGAAADVLAQLGVALGGDQEDRAASRHDAQTSATGRCRSRRRRRAREARTRRRSRACR